MAFNKEIYKDYQETLQTIVKELLAKPSPSGYGHEVTQYILDLLSKWGVEAYRTIKGGVIAHINADPQKAEDNTEGGLLLQAHVDTLGGMVHRIKGTGRLKITPIGGLVAANTEAENVMVKTRDGKTYEGTFQLENASVHVNADLKTQERNWDTMEVVLDEDVTDAESVRALGIEAGDYVFFEPRTRMTDKGYIKSRFLDDKLSAAVLLTYVKYLTDHKVGLSRDLYIHWTIYEEVGHGGSSPFFDGVTESWSVDMGCVGEGLNCTEKQVSIAAKDSGGPYNYDVVNKLIALAKTYDIDYAVDIYPFYGSDVEATLRAGHDFRHALIGPGVYASHGYERSHLDGAMNTFRLIQAYLENQ